MIVIGITGTIGAGKGTIVEYLVEKKGFLHFSVREFLLKKIREMKLTLDRDSMFHLANRLRAEHGPSYVIDQLYGKACAVNKNSIIESIRTTGEIASLRGKGRFYLFAVDADPRLRYERIQLRKSETDAVSFDLFLENEERESVSADPGVPNLRACIGAADFLFVNNGSKTELYQQVDVILSTLDLPVQ